MYLENKKARDFTGLVYLWFFRVQDLFHIFFRTDDTTGRRLVIVVVVVRTFADWQVILWFGLYTAEPSFLPIDKANFKL